MTERSWPAPVRAARGWAARSRTLALGPSRSAPTPQRSTTVSTQRTRVLSAGEVANVPAGRGLHLDGLAWELLTLTPAHQTEPWKTLIAAPAEDR